MMIRKTRSISLDLDSAYAHYTNEMKSPFLKVHYSFLAGREGANLQNNISLERKEIE